jgi:hypothetical protein
MKGSLHDLCVVDASVHGYATGGRDNIDIIHAERCW